MANNAWLGRQKKTAQITTVQVTAYDAATTYRLTIGGIIISTIAQGSVNATAAGLVTAWNASTHGAPAEVTASSSTDTVTLTADTSGTPFTVTSSVSGGSGTIGAASTTTANTSPNDVNDAVNWSNAAVPGAADVVLIDGRTSESLKWNLDALSAVAVTSISVAQSFSGKIGLPDLNISGTAYTEYRSTAWQIQSSTINIGYGPGNGSGLMKFDPGSATATTVNVYSTGSASETGRQALTLLGTNAANVLNLSGGDVGIAPRGGADVATYATINIGPSLGSSPRLRLGSGCTLTTINNDGGTLEINSALTTLTHKAGNTTIIGSGAITTLSCQGGNIVHAGTGTITTLTVASGASFSLGDAGAAIVITNSIQVYKGSVFLDRSFRQDSGNAFVLNQCRLNEVAIDLGPNRTITVT